MAAMYQVGGAYCLAMVAVVKNKRPICRNPNNQQSRNREGLSFDSQGSKQKTLVKKLHWSVSISSLRYSPLSYIDLRQVKHYGHVFVKVQIQIASFLPTPPGASCKHLVLVL